MKKVVNVVQACGLCAVACPAEAITMEAAERMPGEEALYRKKNMQQNMRSICCDAYSVDCVKKHVRKMPFI
jgi:formate hydrogenlyase subunit 6/NADH:ubiquinone oxidoreductase subunit I